MPNWCDLQIEITGPSEEILEIWDSVQEGNGLLETMCPIGEWEYDTATGAWGTKWDISSENLEIIDNDGISTISGNSQSAWSPPIGAFEHFSLSNPNINSEIYYLEEGGFVGSWSSEEGDNRYDIDEAPPYLIEYFELDGLFD